MKTWTQRPIEVRNLFNPAFCGLLLFRAMKAFQAEDEKGLPFSLSLLVLPLSLPANTRSILLAKPRASILKTITDHPEILIDFAERARQLVPCTLESLGFLAQYNSFTVTESGRLLCVPGMTLGKFPGTSETDECQKAAILVGRHLGRVGDRATAYVTLGIRP